MAAIDKADELFMQLGRATGTGRSGRKADWAKRGSTLAMLVIVTDLSNELANPANEGVQTVDAPVRRSDRQQVWPRGGDSAG